MYTQFSSILRAGATSYLCLVSGAKRIGLRVERLVRGKGKEAEAVLVGSVRCGSPHPYEMAANSN
jgi:hypothetical protein